jgi:hypothetical protein
MWSYMLQVSLLRTFITLFLSTIYTFFFSPTPIYNHLDTRQFTEKITS